MLSEGNRHGSSAGHVCPACHLSRRHHHHPPVHLHSEINPTREHRKWVKSPFLHSNPPFRGDFGWRQCNLTYTCVGRWVGWCTRDGETGGMIEKGRGRNFFFFFSLWSSIGSAACCLVTAAPFEKHSVSLEISLKIHSQSAYQTFLLTIGQQHAI